MKKPVRIPVDFNNRDDDGAVRLVTKGTLDFLSQNEIHLEDGVAVMMFDGELSAEGIVVRRHGVLVVPIDRWDEDAD